MQLQMWPSSQKVKTHSCSDDGGSSGAEVIAHCHDAGMEHAGASPNTSQGMPLCRAGLLHPSEGMYKRKCT